MIQSFKKQTLLLKLLILSGCAVLLVTFVVIAFLLAQFISNNLRNTDNNPSSYPVNNPPQAEQPKEYSYHITNNGIISVDREGKITELVSTSKPVMEIAVSPDKQTILYSTADYMEDWDNPEPAELWRLDTSTGTYKSIVKPTGKISMSKTNVSYILNSIGGFAFHPVDEKVVYAIDRTIYFYDLDSGKSTQAGQLEQGNYNDFEWTADGNYLKASWFLHEGSTLDVYSYKTGILKPVVVDEDHTFYSGCCGGVDERLLDINGKDFYIHEKTTKTVGDTSSILTFRVILWDIVQGTYKNIFTKEFTLNHNDSKEKPYYRYADGKLYELNNNTLKTYTLESNKFIVQGERKMSDIPEDKYFYVFKSPYLLAQSKFTEDKLDAKIFMIDKSSLTPIVKSIKDLSELDPKKDDFSVWAIEIAETVNDDIYILAVRNNSGVDIYWSYKVSTAELKKL